MHIEFDRESGVKNHLHRRIEIAVVLRRAVRSLCGVHHWLRIDAEADVIESRGLNQRDVGGCRPRLEVFFGVSLGIVNLREPFAEIDSVTYVREA